MANQTAEERDRGDAVPRTHELDEQAPKIRLFLPYGFRIRLSSEKPQQTRPS
jgi:hypothetical protein